MHPTAPLHLKGRNTQAAYQKDFPRDPFPQRGILLVPCPLSPPLPKKTPSHTGVGETVLISWSFCSKGTTTGIENSCQMVVMLTLIFGMKIWGPRSTSLISRWFVTCKNTHQCFCEERIYLGQVLLLSLWNFYQLLLCSKHNKLNCKFIKIILIITVITIRPTMH